MYSVTHQTDVYDMYDDMSTAIKVQTNKQRCGVYCGITNKYVIVLHLEICLKDMQWLRSLQC